MSDKAKQKEQTQPNDPATKSTIASGSVKMDILLITASMQHQNGLRLNDHNRYAHFCKKKITKLRKFFKITQGKRKFQKMPITADKITDNKILLIAILECERDWSYGMYHKQELTAIGEDIKRLRYHITRKFKRATQRAKEIWEICQQVGDTQTQLEGEAYYYFIEANYQIFKRNFQDALNSLKKSANIYEKISQLKDTIESLEYKERINSMKTSIRLCLYNLSTSKDTFFDEEEFLKNVNVEDIELTSKIEEIKKKISSTTIKEDQYEIKYQGMILPIKNEKLKEGIIKLNELSIKIDKEADLSKKTVLFQDYYNKIDEMVKLVKKEKSEEGNQQSENFAKIYSKILGYFENLRLKKYIEKNIAFITEYSKEYDLELITNLFEKDSLKLKAKPQEIIKLYDNLIEYQTQLINLEKDNPEQLYIVDLNYREKVYSFNKIFYAGLFYILNKKFQDAYTIMFYTLEKLKELREYFSVNNLSLVTSLNQLHDQSEALEKQCLFIINVCFTKLSLDKDKDKDRDKEKTSKGQVIQKEKKIKYNPYLYDTIKNNNEILSKDSYETMKQYNKMSYDEYLEGIYKNTFGNYTQIAQLPMNTQLLEPKPIFYDMIYENFDYPNLEERVKKQQSKGIIGRTFGYFFGQ